MSDSYTETARMHLRKDDASATYDIGVANANLDSIDAFLSSTIPHRSYTGQGISIGDNAGATILITNATGGDISVLVDGEAVVVSADSSVAVAVAGADVVVSSPSDITVQWFVATNSVVAPIISDLNELKSAGAYTAQTTPGELSAAQFFSILQSGLAWQQLHIGDIVEISVTIDGTTAEYPFRIIGFFHDSLTGGGKASATLESTTRFMLSPMNAAASNAGGWGESELRASLAALIAGFPGNWQAAMKSVDKASGTGGANPAIEITSDKLFILSEVESFGTSTNSLAGEGSQYDFYAAGGTHEKPNFGEQSSGAYWMRSAYTGNATGFVNITAGASISYSAASDSYGVPVAFCI